MKLSLKIIVTQHVRIINFIKLKISYMNWNFKGMSTYALAKNKIASIFAKKTYHALRNNYITLYFIQYYWEIIVQLQC